MLFYFKDKRLNLNCFTTPANPSPSASLSFPDRHFNSQPDFRYLSPSSEEQFDTLFGALAAAAAFQKGSSGSHLVDSFDEGSLAGHNGKVHSGRYSPSPSAMLPQLQQLLQSQLLTGDQLNTLQLLQQVTSQSKVSP